MNLALTSTIKSIDCRYTSIDPSPSVLERGVTEGISGSDLYLPSVSKRRAGGENRQHIYILPPLDQARQEFALTTKIPNADWTADREDLLHL